MITPKCLIVEIKTPFHKIAVAKPIGMIFRGRLLNRRPDKAQPRLTNFLLSLGEGHRHQDHAKDRVKDSSTGGQRAAGGRGQPATPSAPASVPRAADAAGFAADERGDPEPQSPRKPSVLAVLAVLQPAREPPGTGTAPGTAPSSGQSTGRRRRAPRFATAAPSPGHAASCPPRGSAARGQSRLQPPQDGQQRQR